MRPRFGWIALRGRGCIDNTPQIIHESPYTLTDKDIESIPVAVIPMPFGGRAAQARVRRLCRDYWWP